MKKRTVSIVVVSVILLTLLFPTIASAAVDYSSIRVQLNSMGSPGSVTFVVKGAYRIAEAGSVDLYPGITYTIKPSGSGMALTYNNGLDAVSVTLPATATFVQYSNGSSTNYLYVNNPSYGWRSYSGNMTFSHPSGTSYLKLINTLFLETYLYGVIAYEMSCGFPLEALKVQAICARTYSLRFVKANYSNAYQIGDTSSYQVYKGLPLNSDGSLQQRVIDAVDATRGQVITIGDPSALALADGVFSASNGGQIRTASMHWGSTNTYHVFKDDPYDIRNPSSPKYTYIFPVKNDADTLSALSASDQCNANNMLALIQTKLVAALKAQKGLVCTQSGITITGIKSAVPAVSAIGAPAGNHEFTQINVTVSVTATAAAQSVQGKVTTSGGTLTIRSQPSASSTALTTAPNGTVLTVLDTGAAAGWYQVQYGDVTGYASSAYITLIDATATPAASPSATATATQTVGAAADSFTGDITVVLTYLSKDSGGDYDVLGELRQSPFTNSLLNDYGNFWNLYAEKSTDGKILYVVARGFGHGVGMSQRGAQQMANEGKTCQQILDFYYNFSTTSATMGAVAVTETALTPIPGKANGQFGTVNAAGLKVRTAPSTSATAVGSLSQGSNVEILDTNGDWYKVLDASAGLVGWACFRSGSTVYVSLTGAVPTTTPTSTPAATASPAPTATKPAATASPTATASPKPTATGTPKPTPTATPTKTATPTPTRTATPTPTPTKTATPTATPSPTPTPGPTPGSLLKPFSGKADVTTYLSLRKTASTTAACLVKIPPKGIMTVLQVYTNAAWLKVTYQGKTGYVVARYVVVGGSSAYRAGTVTITSLNVRSGAGTGYSSMGVIMSGDAVLITGSVKSGTTTWFRIQCGSKSGYINSKYVRSSLAPASYVSAASVPVTVPGKANVSSSLSLRGSASASAACLAQIPKSAAMTVVQVHTATTWLKVTYQGKSGYVLSHYVMIDGSLAYRAGTATAASLVVRGSASTTGSTLGTLVSGNTFTILATVKSGGLTWYKIKYGSKTGYVDSRYVRKSAA